MNLFPAIDLVDGKAVRLIRGDYHQMTVYSDDPVSVAKGFAACGAKYLHVVDLEGARDGNTPNLEVVKRLIRESGLAVEVGGGIRSMDTVKAYIDAGAFRVIIGTAAVTDPDFLDAALAAYGEKIAVGVDIKDGMVAIKGWQEVSRLDCFAFCEQLTKKGVDCVICTDISKDGLLSGTNLALYAELSTRFPIKITASGGVTTVEDVRLLAGMKLYGAILGKALYTGAIDLSEALPAAREENL
ncbi:MAG: 1-(5-phosphoribosyl)-5-[(5-phosphoribosylamino)methylideneamino]imidazole-4-carboxamide isomerase [Ruminococcaceae bacterium]|nr:1-(5-phosphoribosyl)-5-[(5-phosphoribosylamino)methylideneamino]imidazole-4-carboxamide isomerase [Oscillospiraceae bacterium]